MNSSRYPGIGSPLATPSAGTKAPATPWPFKRATGLLYQQPECSASFARKDLKIALMKDGYALYQPAFLPPGSVSTLFLLRDNHYPLK
jgi:hypothetical protein